MIRHIVIWDLKEEFSAEERTARAREIKAGLEGLKALIPGIAEIRCEMKALEGCTSDLILNSLHEDEAALKLYQAHPEHKKVAALLKEATAGRRCMDYTE